jgi:hypothetical protein
VRLFSVVTHIIWHLGQTAYLQAIGVRRTAYGVIAALSLYVCAALGLAWPKRPACVDANVRPHAGCQRPLLSAFRW